MSRRTESGVTSLIAEAWRLGVQYLRFGSVGLAATGTHAAVFVIAIDLLALPPLVANSVAFACAVIVSFIGHFHWTFRDETVGKRQSTVASRRAFARFAVVAMTGFALTSAVVYAVIDVAGLSYLVALVFMVSVVPIVVFLLSKHWAFA